MPPCEVGLPHSLSHFTVPSGSTMLGLLAETSAAVASRPGNTAMIGVSHASMQWRTVLNAAVFALGLMPRKIDSGSFCMIAAQAGESVIMPISIAVRRNGRFE